jgi:hypothetical protein
MTCSYVKFRIQIRYLDGGGQHLQIKKGRACLKPYRKKEKMVKLTDGEVDEYATADEVGGISRTLDKFMKKQDELHDALEGTLDKLLLSLNKMTAQNPVPHEDMGSNVKGKNTAAPHSVKPGSSTPPISTHVNKSVKYGDPPPGDHRKFYTPPSSPKANIIFSEGPDWSTMGNASGAQMTCVIIVLGMSKS